MNGVKWHAALPMYDFAPLSSAHQALWTAVATFLHRRGHSHVPSHLETISDVNAYWKNPNLLFSQCCEYPFIQEFHKYLDIIASPSYSAPCCEPGLYRSLIVARAEDARAHLLDYAHSVVAVNDLSSNSGYNLLQATIAELSAISPFFKNHVLTGSHFESLKAVQQGRADIASIDCVSFAQLHRCKLIDKHQFKILTQSPLAGSLPWVTSKETPKALKQDLILALKAALVDPHLVHTREALLLVDADFEPKQALQLTKEAMTLALTVRLTPKI